MKKCTKCNKIKELYEFHNKSSSKDGFRCACKECYSAIGKVYRLINKETIAIKNKERYIKRSEQQKDHYNTYLIINKERNLKSAKIYQNIHRKQINAINKSWNLANPEKRKEIRQKFEQFNPDKVNAKTAKRRAAKLQRTPRWLTKNDYVAIMRFYTIAHNLTISTGITHQVDHIVPLQGKEVSGLHVPWNLQVVTKIENCIKGNRI